MPGVHKELSASQAERWSECTASIGAVRAMPAWQLEAATKSSWYADEGTAAHRLLHECLTPILTGYGPSDPHEYIGAGINPADGTFLMPAPFPIDQPLEGWFVVTDEMADSVEIGVQAVEEIMQKLASEGKTWDGIEVQLENTWDMDWLHPKMGGTSDYKASTFLTELVVMDYKHGKGIMVEVYGETDMVLKRGKTMRGNRQLLTYLLAAAHEDGFSHALYTAVICQPRKFHEDGPTRSITYTREQLLDFKEFIQEKAVEADTGEGAVFKAGPHCLWCPKSGDCAEQDRQTAAEVDADFDVLPPESLEVPTDMERIARKLKWVPVIDAWIKGTQAFAMRAALAGEDVPGKKIVEGKTNRRIRDGQALIDTIKEAELDTAKLFTEPKLKSASQIEKLGKEYKKLVNAKDPDTGEFVHTYKPHGKLALVDESDPRAPADLSNLAEFTDLGEEETNWDD